jgi:hypothetical protein
MHFCSANFQKTFAKKTKKSACAGDCFVHKNALKFGLGDNDEKKNLSIIKIIFKKKKNNITRLTFQVIQFYKV